MFAKLMEHTSTVLTEADRSMLPQIVVVVNKQSTTIAITITITLTTNTTTATTNRQCLSGCSGEFVESTEHSWVRSFAHSFFILSFHLLFLLFLLLF